jgi:hypothetical protein
MRDSRTYERADKQIFLYTEFEGGPSKNRRCTDVLCLLLIFASWAAMTLLGLAALGVVTLPEINKGDSNRLFHGIL